MGEQRTLKFLSFFIKKLKKMTQNERFLHVFHFCDFVCNRLGVREDWYGVIHG